MAATLAVALERGRWDVAALCLALGVVEAASRLPPDSLQALLALLQEDTTRRRGRLGR
ncbi:MAG: hypothetical protein NZ695_07815 [Dehalococcoidia bacterium]|jgi:hypothetical protein|nr:hypothetical protein [Dehalococcoidia bacterium]MDW8008312.1 hypothetical protein [Chloroflexota bacterium]